MLDHQRKPNYPLWGGLWVPFAALIFGLAAAGVLSATVAIVIYLVVAPASVAAASVVLRRRIRRQQGR
jgi:hypothetical protein